MRRLPAFFVLVMVALVAAGCPGAKPPATGQTPPKGANEPLAIRLSKSGLGFRLSNADAEADNPPARNVAPATALAAEDAKKIASRMPALAKEADDVKAFAMREKSLPAPRAGKTVSEAFPPPASLPPATTTTPGPLTVERHAPEGPVDLAPHLSITFSQPMVPVGSIADLTADKPPVTLTPQPPGKWRWLGTRTVLFQPDGGNGGQSPSVKRFPMATEYVVDVPQGTRSTTGGVLAKAEHFTFTTPPPKLKTVLPRGSSVPLEPTIFVELDQAIDQEKLLASLELGTGSQSVGLRLATADEIEGDDAARRASQQAEKGRWLAVRPTRRLANAQSYVVKLKAGAPSAEGPRKTTADQTDHSFVTFGPLKVTERHCAWYWNSNECKPLDDINISFSNPLDATKFDKKLVAVSPAIPGLKVEVGGNNLRIAGRTKGQTHYTVTLAAALTDTHGQTLGKDTNVEVDVGHADPVLFGAEHPMVVLDPSAPRAFDVYSVNEPGLRTRVYAVEPRDWTKFQAYTREWERPRKVAPPGRLVYERVVTPKKAPDELVSTPIDLAPALAKGTQVVVLVEPIRALPKDWSRAETAVWVQATELGVQAFVENDQLTGWVTRLSNGAAMPGVELSILDAGGPVKTDSGGLGRIMLGAKGPLLVAKNGNDLAILPHGDSWSSDVFVQRYVPDSMRFFVYDDRGMYKPGEEVRIKGWARKIGGGRGGDVDAIRGLAGQTLTYRVRDGRYADIGKGEAKVDESGGFDLLFKLPGNANLGEGHVEISTSGAQGVVATTHTHGFAIQEFRRPEFEVSARTSEGPHLVGKHAIATVTASYYAGGGLPSAPVTWRVGQQTVPYQPPNRSEFHFGPAPEPFGFWWRPPTRPSTKATSETWTAQTDGAGAHRLRLDFDAVDPPFPMKLDLTAEVVDVNRQQWAANSSFLVHPGDRTVGLKLAKGLVRSGENVDVDMIVTDIDGKAAGGHKVATKLVRLDSEQKGNTWEETETVIATCETESIATGPTPTTRCAMKSGEGGTYKVIAVVTDDAGRKSRTEVRVWVVGNERPKDRGLPKSVAQVIADKKDYEPGAMAELLVVAPFAPAEGVLTLRRQGIVHVERFSMPGTTHVMKVKLEDAMVPNVEAEVHLVGAAVRDNASGEPDPSLAKRPAYASGRARLGVLPTSRKLAVTAKPKAQALEPGAKTEVLVEVKDASGRPVPDASVAVTVVDEAVLALSGYKTPDPLALFYTDRGSEVTDVELRARVLLADPDLAALKNRGSGGVDKSPKQRAYPMRMEAAGGAPGAPPPPSEAPSPSASMSPIEAKPQADQGRIANAEKKKEEANTVSVVGDTKVPIAVRTNFDALALFAPRVKTDGAGRATVALALPDNLTRYRVMAVAVTGGKQFGSGESTVTARLPVMARLSAPRFLNFGDKFQLPVVVQNQTDAPVDVGVVVRATNATMAEPVAKKIRVAANDRVEVRFDAAADKAGKARFQVGIATGSFADASQVEVPVYTPATTEAFATYGEIDDGALAQPVKPPPNVFPQFGGLEITTSSTQLQALTDAFLYLVRYPFECNEQLSSRVVSIAALKDVLTAFKAEGMPKPDELNAFAKEDLEKLKRRQKYDGGWGFWQEESWPYLSVHVAHALVRAKDKGFAPDPQMMQRSLAYLRSIESRYPAWYSADTRRAITSYALYVRKRMNDADPARARRLVAEAGGVPKMPMEALGWLWPTISADKASAAENEAIRRHVANRAEETAGAAHFTSGYKDGGNDTGWVLLHSDRRADGILLEALIQDQPQSTLIPKIVRGLLAHRKKGRWSNTQENAFVLLALDTYFATYEKATPDFVARAWLGDRFAGEHTFKGRTTEYSSIQIPMSWVADEMKGKTQDLVLGKNGPGRLYYRVGMQYAPTDLKMPPADQGFVVSRIYEGVDKPEDVRREADGTWRMKAGARVRARVTMVASARRYHVALVDPIPAGLEPMNPALAVTGEIPKDPKVEAQGGKYGYWNRTWYEHQNMRDERVEAFASLLWDGVWDYSYVARATTPGTFVVPPAKAEEMYSPEVFGRSAGDRVIVE